jgi:AcrR family transcriptional regulator
LSTPPVTSLPRRPRADAIRNREKVLAAARAAFAEHGSDAQMEDVARRAGVGVGTVYRHFATKQALAEALVEERFATIVANAQQLLEDPDPWRAIERSFEFCATTQERDRSVADVLATVAGRGATGPPEHLRDELNAITERMLARARAAGAIRPDLTADDMPALYCALASVVMAGVADWRRYLELMLAGLRAP